MEPRISRWAIIAVMLSAPFAVRAQPTPDESPNAETTSTEQLRQMVEDVDERHEEELEHLHRALDDLHETVIERADGSQRQRLNVFNPRVTAFGNFVGRLDSKPVRTDEGDAIHNRFNLREVELDFRAAIDPWADGVITIAFESEAPNEFETGIEEGYVVLKRLPVVDVAPLGLKLQAGRFRASFGRFNKIHTHDLPQTSRPMSLQTFLGEEGFIQNGVSAQMFIPTPGESNSLQVTLQSLDRGGLPVSETETEGAAFVGDLRWFWELGSGHDAELGASTYLGNFDTDTRPRARLYGVDLTYRWKPFGGGEWRSFLLAAEAYLADADGRGNDPPPMGAFAWLQYQLDRNLYIGARYDVAQALEDTELVTQSYAGFLSYYTTEFLRFRLGYEYTGSDLDELDGRHTGLLELNFVFGSHPVEPYWVNR